MHPLYSLMHAWGATVHCRLGLLLHAFLRPSKKGAMWKTAAPTPRGLPHPPCCLPRTLHCGVTPGAAPSQGSSRPIRSGPRPVSRPHSSGASIGPKGGSCVRPGGVLACASHPSPHPTPLTL